MVSNAGNRQSRGIFWPKTGATLYNIITQLELPDEGRALKELVV